MQTRYGNEVVQRTCVRASENWGNIIFWPSFLKQQWPACDFFFFFFKWLQHQFPPQMGTIQHLTATLLSCGPVSGQFPNKRKLQCHVLEILKYRRVSVRCSGKRILDSIKWPSCFVLDIQRVVFIIIAYNLTCNHRSAWQSHKLSNRIVRSVNNVGFNILWHELTLILGMLQYWRLMS